jgi:hypothetical protein
MSRNRPVAENEFEQDSEIFANPPVLGDLVGAGWG